MTRSSVAPHNRAAAGLPDHDPSRGRWYPWLFVAAFLVVIAANGVMVSFAIGSFAGLETDHPYERGLAYNATLAASRAQETLGWQVSYVAAPGGTTESGARSVELQGRFLDREGAPLSGLSVRAILKRPATAGYDQEIELSAWGDGRYGTVAELPLPGQWDLHLVAVAPHGGPEESWQSSRRILLP